MTLQDFFNLLGDNPRYVVIYFLMLPIFALLGLLLGKGEGNVSPWREYYSVIVFGVCIPGILAIALSVYLFLFERRSIMQTDILSQVLPIVSMFGTLRLVGMNADVRSLPGFGSISSLVTMIAATFAAMWLIQRTHIFVFSSLPFWQVIVIFGLLFLVMRFALSRILRGG